jgi:pyruvate,orthophosphate dikinase
MPVVVAPVAAFLEEGGEAAGADPVVNAVALLLGHADASRRLGVRANADTPEDAARARRMGAAGIGLCRTEHMFLGERRELVQRLILATDAAEQSEALEALVPLQRSDFVGLLEAMDGLPVTIRLLDPPLHEFLPDLTSLSVEVALAEARGDVDPVRVELLAAVHRLHEENPMIGLRGVRLGLTIPALFAVQVRALAEATADRLAAGGDPRPEIMVPLVATVRELEIVRDQTGAVLAEVGRERGTDLSRILIGTMIETPRAAITAGAIAPVAQFFSFGTNDLTQMTWGFSRDDVEASFFSTYLELGILETSPFESLDVAGVGALLRTAVAAGREARPDIHLGVCGEHAGDPRSIHFLHDAGVDYLSCSPFRAPVARLEAGRAAVLATSAG